MVDPVALDGIAQGADDVLLAHDLVEGLGAMAAVERGFGAHRASLVAALPEPDRPGRAVAGVVRPSTRLQQRGPRPIHFTVGNRLKTTLAAAAVALAVAGLGAPSADAEMRSTKVGKHLCKTVGGGKFVGIPGFPGEKVDRRLLPDIRWMRRNYKIFITDAYAPSGHAAAGEHPIGLALDIVPDSGSGGNWKLITKLAKRFEPHQNQVRPPMRWVGYNGDTGHGRGNHLHLSYLHSDTQPRHPAHKVYTRSCPSPPGDGTGGGGDGGGQQGSGGGGHHGGGNGGGSGGVGPKAKSGFGGLTQDQLDRLAPAVPEYGE